MPPAVAARTKTRTVNVATVSHTLPPKIYDRLRKVAFDGKLSGSAVIEHALDELFEGKTNAQIIAAVRDAGGGARRVAR